MNNDEKIMATAYHEAGHILAIYLLFGDFEKISFARIECDNNDDCQEKIYSGSTNVISGFEKFDGEIKNSPGFEKYGNDFAIACYFFSGGVADRLMTNKFELDYDSMSEDIEKFNQNCKNIEASENIKNLAIRFCEDLFLKKKNELKALAEKLKEVSCKDGWGLDNKQIQWVYDNVKQEKNR